MTYEEAREMILSVFCWNKDTSECNFHINNAGQCDECVYTTILEALEKQIPMKPNKDVDTTWGIRKKVNVCPKCDYYLGNHAFINTLEKNKVTYCETCGQAIDWSEVE